MATETRLILIRHGESRAQVDGVVSGHDTCGGLSDAGRGQAKALHRRLASTGELDTAAVIYTSILSRATETAAIVRQAIGAGSLTAQTECDWCELHAGEAEGLTWSEMRARFPPVGDPDDPFRRRLPGMETWAEFYVRVGTRLTEVTDEHEGSCIVVIAHGGSIGASFITFGDLPIRRGISLTRATTNTSITEWCRGESDWQLIRFNDHSHLTPTDES